METMGSMKASVSDWVGETVSDRRLTEAINDSIANLWHSVLLVNLSQFAGGPVNLSLAAGAERADIVSIPNPTQICGTDFGQPTGVPTGMPTHNVYCKYTFVTDSGSETLGSPEGSASVPPNDAVCVIRTSAPTSLDGVVGWNAYVAPEVNLFPGPYYRINESPIPFSIDRFYEPIPGGVPYGAQLPLEPTVNNTSDDVMCVRKLQVKTPDGTYKTWEAADIDSQLFRWAERSLASTSEYQSYVYDFLNGRTLEIRPALGTTLVPRYFFVRKPRRIKFDSSIIPFTNIEGIAFLRYRALGLLSLSIHEYDASTAWLALSEKERANVLLAVNIESNKQNNNITPHMR